MTASAPPSSPAVNSRAGRGLLVAGTVLALLAIASLLAQWRLGFALVPWQVPIMTAIGALLVLWSLSKRVTVVRGIVLLLVVGLGAFEWFVIASARLPQYTGPAQAGQPMPPFRTTLANGSPLTDDDLQDGRPRVLTFFRGRW